MSAQVAGSTAPISVRVDLVQLYCIVEDQHSSPIQGLTLNDFAVKEDRHAVPAQYLRTDHDVCQSLGERRNEPACCRG